MSLFDVTTSELLISYPIIFSLRVLCVLCSTGEPGAEAFLDAMFEDLASTQKSGKEVKGNVYEEMCPLFNNSALLHKETSELFTCPYVRRGVTNNMASSAKVIKSEFYLNACKMSCTFPH